ncbi:Hypothetical predicted protein [Olea europaea subsp. europaea]|uniref:Uncharacterized protein n=1 Tax=Olea europaea subsp. europaea TaxID=158383 RepID=A0A8S0UM21_OLEEU|nr:Hypothetical predicted protein [Olea europaea subsp. europaea]
MEGLRGGLSLLFSCNKAEVGNDDLELQEEDVWYNYKSKEEQDSGSNSNPKKNLNYSFDLALATPLAWSIPIVPKIILKANNGGVDGRNGGHQEPTPTKVAAPRTFAPITIPDWSKICPLNPNKELWEATCDLEKAFIDFIEPDDDGGELIPPHIILARREALNRCISHSMVEGTGRTLKGRDLANMRISVLKLTGFIET